MIPSLILISASIVSAESLALLFVRMWFMIEKPLSHSLEPTAVGFMLLRPSWTTMGAITRLFLDEKVQKFFRNSQNVAFWILR